MVHIKPGSFATMEWKNVPWGPSTGIPTVRVAWFPGCSHLQYLITCSIDAALLTPCHPALRLIVQELFEILRRALPPVYLPSVYLT